MGRSQEIGDSATGNPKGSHQAPHSTDICSIGPGISQRLLRLEIKDDKVAKDGLDQAHHLGDNPRGLTNQEIGRAHV